MSDSLEHHLAEFLNGQVDQDWLQNEVKNGIDREIMAILLTEIFLRMYLTAKAPNNVDVTRRDEIKSAIIQWISIQLEQKVEDNKEKEMFLAQFKDMSKESIESHKQYMLKQYAKSKTAKEKAIIEMRFMEIVGMPIKAVIAMAKKKKRKKK